MIEHIYVRPVEGRRVRDPQTRVVLTAPCRKPRNSYWLRRIAQGDVVEVSPEQPKTAERKDTQNSEVI